jgi:hypothetical protein
MCNTLLVISDVQCLPEYVGVIFSMKHVIHTSGNTVEFQYFELKGTSVALDYQKPQTVQNVTPSPKDRQFTVCMILLIMVCVCVCMCMCIYRYIVYIVNIYLRYKKGKDISVTGHGGPYGCETSRLPHFLDDRLTGSGEVVSLTCRPATLYPQEDSWYSFLLEAELT